MAEHRIAQRTFKYRLYPSKAQITRLNSIEQLILRAILSSSCSLQKRDVSAAKRFFKKLMRADHRRLPFSISVDKNAAYPDAFTSS